MPFISIKTWPGHSEEEKQALAEAVVQDVVRCFRAEPGWISVVIEDVEPENWETEVGIPEIRAKKDRLYYTADDYK